MELTVVDAGGKKVGTKEVSDSLFATEVKTGLLYETTRLQRASKRAGTHTVLTRAKVRGGGAKPWRQKGTGRARAGSSSSPVWVGGGIAHGPKQRDYSFKLNKKEKRLAICSALSARVAEGKVIALDSFGLSEIKTKEAYTVLSKIGVSENSSTLVVLKENDQTVEKSLRNISGIKVINVAGLNVYDILNANYLVVVGDALEGIEGRLAGKSS